jgi:transcription elongation factor S-II
MMKHWPKEEEPQVVVMMRRIAARVPGAAGVAATQVRALLTAFQDPKNEKLRGDVMGEMIDIERLVRMNEMELTNPEQQAKCEREFLERNKSKDWTELKKSMSAGSSDMFKCPRCEQRNTMWEQRQTRSADEPMTIIITCNNCGFYWRKRG